MATAHKIAVIFYTMVKNQVEYDETIWSARDAGGETVGSKTQTASQTTGLRTCPHRIQGCIMSGVSLREFLGSAAVAERSPAQCSGGGTSPSFDLLKWGSFIMH
jgi:hypothetical protein